MLKLNLKNSNYTYIQNTQNRPYLLNEKINTNIKDSIKIEKNNEIKDEGKNWAKTILSNESNYNKIALKWAKKIIEINNEKNMSTFG